MHEYKHGQLHSGSSRGPVVTKRKQAVAIALSEQRQRGVKLSRSAKVHTTTPHPHRNLKGYLHPKKHR